MIKKNIMTSSKISIIESWEECLKLLYLLESSLDRCEWVEVGSLSVEVESLLVNFFKSNDMQPDDLSSVVSAEDACEVARVLNKVAATVAVRKDSILSEANSLGKGRKGVSAYKKV